MSEWMPIETAPKDGTEIILLEGARVGAAYWVSWPSSEIEEASAGWSVCWDGDIWRNPTKWRPMVAAPGAEAQQAQPPEPVNQWLLDALCELVDAVVENHNNHFVGVKREEKAIKNARTAIKAAEAEPKASPTAGMTIAQRILHVGGRNNSAGYVEFGSIQAVEALVHQVIRDIPAPKAEAREPLTEELATLRLISDEYNAWIRAQATGQSYDEFLLQRIGTDGGQQ